MTEKMEQIVRIIMYIAIIYAVVAVFAYALSNSILFLPPHPSYKDSNKIIKLKTTNGVEIAAVYHPNLTAKYTILVSHGNSEDLGTISLFLQFMRDHGFAVFAYDYHGYGQSAGRPSEHNAYLDINAAYNYMRNQLNIPADRIIAYGRSIGAAVSIDLAAQKPLAGLIIQSPFVSAFRVVTHISLFPFDRFNNLAKIKQVKCPVLVIHGKKDKIIRFWHAKKLYQAIPTQKNHYWVENAGHNDLNWVAGEEFWHNVNEFVSMLGMK